MSRVLNKAIEDGEIEMVALLWRNAQISEELEKRQRKLPSITFKMSPEDLLLAVVAPPEEIKERSLRKARELVAAGDPFARTQTCACEGCENTFTSMIRGRPKRFCSDLCRKRTGYRNREALKRSSPEYRKKMRRRHADRARENIARGLDWLMAFECAQGHERTPQNTFLDAARRRRCRDCIRQNRQRIKRRAA